jgi:hypothetical protein
MCDIASDVLRPMVARSPVARASAAALRALGRLARFARSLAFGGRSKFK